MVSCEGDSGAFWVGSLVLHEMLSHGYLDWFVLSTPVVGWVRKLGVLLTYDD